jgi:hypothetical protein
VPAPDNVLSIGCEWEPARARLISGRAPAQRLGAGVIRRDERAYTLSRDGPG